MHRLDCQSFQCRTQTISSFLPGKFQFAEFLGVDYYVDRRIRRRALRIITCDCHPGRETLYQSV